MGFTGAYYPMSLLLLATVMWVLHNNNVHAACYKLPVGPCLPFLVGGSFSSDLPCLDVLLWHTEGVGAGVQIRSTKTT